MSKDDVDVVVALLNTSTVKQAATVLGVTDRTVRNRRHDVLRQLRELADVA
jgi:DNA-directed RNA polymerase specialized sigma24 family protein